MKETNLEAAAHGVLEHLVERRSHVPTLAAADLFMFIPWTISNPRCSISLVSTIRPSSVWNLDGLAIN
jgi:hypothetical protein